MHPHVHWSIVYNSQDTKANQVSMNGSRRCERDIHVYTHTHIERYTHNGIKLGQKEQNLVMCDNTDEPWEYYVAEINQKKTNTTWVHLYVESKRKNKQANETETDL